MEGEGGVWREEYGWRIKQGYGERGRSMEREGGVWREREECGGRGSVEGEEGVWRGRGMVLLILIQILICWSVNLLFESCVTSFAELNILPTSATLVISKSRTQWHAGLSPRPHMGLLNEASDRPISTILLSIVHSSGSRTPGSTTGGPTQFPV